MSGKSFYAHQHQERLYYSNTIRTACVALVSKENGKFPWEYDAWQKVYPELCAFMSDPDSEYGETKEGYIELLGQFSNVVRENPWLNQHCHDFVQKDIDEYLPPYRLRLKKHRASIAAFILGFFAAWALF